MWITCRTQGLTTHTPHLPQVIDGLVVQGIPAHRIVVAGFSQGGATATLSSYTYPARCSLLRCGALRPSMLLLVFLLLPLLLLVVLLRRQLIFFHETLQTRWLRQLERLAT